MAHIIQCASDLSFHARKMRGSEANLFTDKQIVRKGLLVGRILGATFEDLISPGPYKIGQGGAPPWDQMLTGDRVVALIGVRVATYDSAMPFKVQCDASNCRRRYEHDLDLVKDLKIKRLSVESANLFAAGNKFITELHDGGANRTVHFHLGTARDEPKVQAAREAAPNDQVTASLSVRIDSIEGVESNDLIRYLNGLDLDELQDLVSRMDDADCGVDTEIETECTFCGNIQETEVPLGGREFFLPKRRKVSPT